MKIKNEQQDATYSEHRLKGHPISGGVASGAAFFFTLREGGAPDFEVSKDEVDHEVSRYERALDATTRDIQLLRNHMIVEKIEEGAAILEAHLQMIKDPLITESVELKIRQSRRNAESVLNTLINDYQSKFCALDDPFFRERFKDIEGISQRVMAHLRRSIRVTISDIPHGSILFAEELSASDAAEACSGNVAALVTARGGVTSHTAIVAKAKGIPYVTNIDIAKLQYYAGCDIIVDGEFGEVIIAPFEETRLHYNTLAKSRGQKQNPAMGEIDSRTPETIDGYAIRLSVNLDDMKDFAQAKGHGCHGIGLFRSEYLFLSHAVLPPEEEQYQLYRRIIDQLRGFPIVIRTFDIGGDKQLKQNSSIDPSSAALGCRALRYLLRERAIFQGQVAALLRAAVAGDVSVLLPMVTSVSELLEAKALIAEVQNTLEKRRVPFKRNIRIGCMIEVPSAALIADLLSHECDFFSIGTNDLIQYALAADRVSDATDYTPSHPSIIRLIKWVVSAANSTGIPVSVCGEVAADPRFTPLLLGLGVHELSVALPYVPMIKRVIRSTRILDAVQLTDKALTLPTSDAVLALLEQQQCNVAAAQLE